LPVSYLFGQKPVDTSYHLGSAQLFMTTGSGIFPTNQSISVDFYKSFSVTRPRGLGIGTGFRSNPSAAAPVKSQNTGQQSGEDLLDVIDGKKGKNVFFFFCNI
jgi:hypothetical protein